MAKGEQRSNREAKKPKKPKLAEQAAPTPFAAAQKKILDAVAQKKK